MVGRHPINNSIWKHRIKITVALLLTFAIINIIQIVILQSHLESNDFKEEPIDVVYTWVNGNDPIFTSSMHKYLKLNLSYAQDYSHQRYDDKYELKFSLRSLEKFAPWIRHVYIVTNGQIPYWLNLDYEKVTLVTHYDIFLDNFDLPTFSSPAIESHLHRIPGLSNRFIYFNDDIFLGKPMYLDDFDSPSYGYFIYLAWPLPMCAADCPWVYVGDGQCDSSCYNQQCQLDGGDCDNYSKEQLWNGSDILIENELKTNQSININQRNNGRKNREILNINNSKIGLPIENIQLNRFVIKPNLTNLSSYIEEHNRNVILRNKIVRKKRQYGSGLHKVTINGFDAYGASLQYTNRVYNLKYGFKTRYAPAHAPILIDKNIMDSLQQTFGKEFRKTSRNRFRSKDDMQYAFSYYYFLINEKRHVSLSEIFDRFDTDASGTWSDREIRTLLTKLYNLPLSYATVDHFEELLVNCSKQHTFPEFSTPEYERYVDSKLPVISKELILKCPLLSIVLLQRFGLRHKYKYEILHNAQNAHVTFKMLSSNVSDVVAHLDEIRRSPKKFICLNDNMNDDKYSENELIRAVLYDFYLSLFPYPSKFELPNDFRNRFSYMHELNQWKSYHLKLRICTYSCIFILCYLTYCNLFKMRFFYRFFNKLFK